MHDLSPLPLNNTELLIGTCHRSPSSCAENSKKLLQLLEVAVTESRLSNIMIIGDFNYPDIDYAGYFVNAGPQSEQQIFFDKTQDLFLFQHVN